MIPLRSHRTAEQFIFTTVEILTSTLSTRCPTSSPSNSHSLFFPHPPSRRPVHVNQLSELHPRKDSPHQSQGQIKIKIHQTIEEVDDYLPNLVRFSLLSVQLLEGSLEEVNQRPFLPCLLTLKELDQK